LWDQAHAQPGDVGPDGSMTGQDGQPAEEGSVEDQFGPLAGLLGQGGGAEGGDNQGGADQGGGGPGGNPPPGGPMQGPQQYAKSQVKSSPGQKSMFDPETSRANAAAKWKEELHPREADGKFGEKGTGHVSSATEAPGGIRAKQKASSPGQGLLGLAGDAAEQVGMPVPGQEQKPKGDEQPFALSGKPVKGKTAIPGSGKTTQVDLFAGRGDAPGQTSFFDDVDPAAKNVGDQGKPVEKASEPPLADPPKAGGAAGGGDDEPDEHLERAREVVKRIPRVSARGLAVQLNGEVSEEHAAELLEKLRGGKKPAAAEKPAEKKPARIFQTAGEAAKAGKSYADWQGEAHDAFVNEEIDEDHPAWQAVQSGTAPSVQEFNDAKSLHGQHVEFYNYGNNKREHGKVTDVSDDGKTVIVTRPNGSTYKASASELGHLGATIEHRNGKGKESPAALEYLAPKLAVEQHSNGENIAETMRRHGLDPVKNIKAREAIAAERAKLVEAEKPQPKEPSEARAKAMEQQELSGAKPVDEAAALARKWKKNEDGTYTSPNGTIWRKAAAGGENSPVTGAPFKGGALMPIHGMHEKPKENPPKGDGQGGGAGKVKEEGKRPIQPMTAEQRQAELDKRARQAKWDAIRKGPMGEPFAMGEKPGKMHGGTKLWENFVEKSGLTKEQVKELGDHFQAIDQHATESTIPAEGMMWKGEHVSREEAIAGLRHSADWQINNFNDYWRKKWLKSHPDMPRAAYFVGEHISQNQGRATDEVDRIHDIHEAVEKLRRGESLSVQPAEVTAEPPAAEPPATHSPAITAAIAQAHEQLHAAGLATAPEPPEPDDIDSPSGQAFADETPREAAARETKKQIDENYAFARKSEVPNAGEDLLGSARHKRNEWKSLADAEKDGTAATLVTRENLFKNEPHGLLAKTDAKNVLSSLAGHYAINSFPAAPFDEKTLNAYAKAYSPRGSEPAVTKHPSGKEIRARTPEELRKQYYDAYSDVKSEVEKSVAAGDDPNKVMQRVHDLTQKLIHKYRDATGSPGDYSSGVTAADRFNPVANALVDLYKRSRPYSNPRHYNAHSVGKKLIDFSERLKKAYGDTPSEDMLEKAAGHAQDIMEGHSANKTFGTVGTKKNEFNPADLYVKHATRKGGRMIDAATVKAATDYMTGSLKMRGIQHGNSVTDEERQHHLQKSSEAFADLMDATGLDDHHASMGGKLGIAFGARGRGGALAHYEPSNQVINLTRASGVGSLAHEWGHFFDHALMDFGISNAATNRADADFMSERADSGSREPIHKAYGDLKEAWLTSGFRTRLADHISEQVRNGKMTEAKAKYWGTGREVFARTFERYVQHKLGQQDRENTYLAGMRKQSHPLWPSDDEVAVMAPAFDAIFAAYKAREKE